MIMFAAVPLFLYQIVQASEYGWSDRKIEEASPMSKSKDKDWWVNSGAYWSVSNGIGRTVAGKLPEKDRWRRLYASSNPEDTDEGYRPQNIARFVTMAKFGNITEQVYFRIVALNKSASENRDASNGVLFFSRYQNGDELYYLGLRVDGRPVIKKKIGGKYPTLANPKAIFRGRYDRERSPNLIPEGKWIGIKAETLNEKEGVRLRLYVDKDADNKWQLAAEALDDGNFAGTAITRPGHAGLRSDFMDVEYRDFKIDVLPQPKNPQ